MPSLPLRPALAPRDGISSFASIQSSDSYYSNEEIAILHDVVTAAQDNLDLLPEGERLATNALFQAYDAVLPNYGVDPEEDHHISRLVFRVGGERGDGSLLDKLRNVLARMGIELEFDSRSEGSRPFSDPGDERDHEIPLQRSPQSNSEHNSATTDDDDSSEHIQLPQQGRSRPIPAPDEAVRNGDRANLQRLMPTLPRPSHLAPELSERLEHLSQSHSPSTAAGTEPSHQSLRSVAGSNEHRGASDTTIQPVETVAHNAGKNVSIATSLPVRSKSVRTVNWLLPEDVGARPIVDGQETSRAEQNIHYEPIQPQSEQYLPRKEQLPFYPNQNTSHDQYPLYEQPQQYLPQQGNLHQEQPVAQNDVHHLQHEQFQHYTLPQQSSAPQNQQQPQQRRQQLHIDETPGNEVSGRHSNISTAVQHETGKRPSIDAKVLGQESSSIERHKVQQQQQQIAPVPPNEPSGDNVLFNRQAAPPDEQLEGDPAMDARYAWLGKRAARAARYLQILRGISHWETYAAEKRERTAVARRHILRMRHFDPWELVTADAKLKGRRIFTSRLLTLWARWADDGVVMEQRVVTIAARRLADGVLTAWSGSCSTVTRVSVRPQVQAVCLQKWRSSCSALRVIYAHTEEYRTGFWWSLAFNSWHQQMRYHQDGVANHRRLGVVQKSLDHWQLETRVEIFRARMGFNLVRDTIGRWRNACRLPPHRIAPGYSGHRRHTKNQADPKPPQAHGMHSPLAISHRLLKTKVLDIWHRQALDMARFSKRSRGSAKRQAARQVVDTWQAAIRHSSNYCTWAQRGYFFTSVNTVVKTWRSKGAWRSHTRKSYARCRQHVKATSTKEYLIRWKSLARVHRNLGWEATKHLSMEKRDRVVGFLDVWYKESSRDRGASRLLTAAWLGEWHIISQEHTSMHGRSKEVWQETLKMRYWGQWQSTVLQLKSREYVATDVRERNKKQLVRRLLHHWKGDGDMARSQHFSAMRASLGSSRKGTGLGISRQSLQLSRTVHERPGTGLFRASNPQEMGPPVEEEEDQDGGGSAADADGIVVSTPTRWTGMASSVQLPSMTPFAPLPTPFERELRERYNRSVPPAQAGQLSRLSLAQAQRLSTADVSVRRANGGRPGALGQGH